MVGRIALVCAAGAVLAATAAAQRPPKPALDVETALSGQLTEPRIAGSFEQALIQLGRLSGLRFQIDRAALQQAGVGMHTKVAVRAKRATAEQLLEMVLTKVQACEPLGWRISGDAVLITTQRKLLQPGPKAPLRRIVTIGQPASRPSRAPAVLPGLELSEMPLWDVIEFLRQQTKLNIHVNWRSLQQVGIDRDTPVTLKVSGVSPAKVLDLITDEISGARGKFDRVWWVRDGGVIRIATGAALNTELRIRIYDVADLLMPVPQFAAPPLGLGGTSSSSSSTGDVSTGAVFSAAGRTTGGNGRTLRQDVQQNLIETIKSTADPDMWQPIGKGTIKIIRGRMVISQTLLGFAMMDRASGR